MANIKEIYEYMFYGILLIINIESGNALVL